MRLFVAIETPPEVRKQLSALIAELRSLDLPVKWEQTDKLHLTLKFIGDTAGENIPAITTALKAAATNIPDPLLIRYGSLGMFPDRARPRIFWVGVENPDGVLRRLQSSVEQVLEPLGIEREQRPFHPHVTIGRFGVGKITDRLLAQAETLTLHADQVSVSEFTLMKSELKPDGAIHTVLERFPIGRGNPDQPAP